MNTNKPAICTDKVGGSEGALVYHSTKSVTVQMTDQLHRSTPCELQRGIWRTLNSGKHGNMDTVVIKSTASPLSPALRLPFSGAWYKYFHVGIEVSMHSILVCKTIEANETTQPVLRPHSLLMVEIGPLQSDASDKTPMHLSSSRKRVMIKKGRSDASQKLIDQRVYPPCMSS